MSDSIFNCFPQRLEGSKIITKLSLCQSIFSQKDTRYSFHCKRISCVLLRVMLYLSKLGGDSLKISYKKLWKLLIDKDMRKLDLQHATGLSSAVIAKLGKGENVNTDVLLKICKALDCDTSDIMEVQRMNEE